MNWNQMEGTKQSSQAGGEYSLVLARRLQANRWILRTVGQRMASTAAVGEKGRSAVAPAVCETLIPIHTPNSDGSKETSFGLQVQVLRINSDTRPRNTIVVSHLAHGIIGCRVSLSMT